MAGSGEQDRRWRERAEAVIPGGMYGHQSTALLPDEHPQFYARASGARLWDTDGHEYLDYLCAYGPNLFGYADAAIDAAAAKQTAIGDTMSGASPLLVQLAEALVRRVEHAAWAMLCKNGTDATSMAMMVARAHTRRRKIVLAKGAYHGAAPWCTPVRAGTLREDRAHQLFHAFNDVASLEAAVREAGDDLAAVLVSAFRHDAFVDQEMLDPAYARRARELCDETGALLVVDEVRAGFRLARDCSWSLAGVKPDLSTWGKTIANGHPISALLGSEPFRVAASSIYATGSFWFSAAPMAAALATLDRIESTDYVEHMARIGARLREELHGVAGRHGFGLRQTGPVQMPQVLFEDDPELRLGFCWTGELAKRGVLFHPWHNMFLCAAMTERDVARTLEAADAAFRVLRDRRSALGPVEKLKGLLQRGAH